MAGELSSSQAAVLARLLGNEPQTTSGLAGAEHVRPQSMAVTVAAMVDQGLVRRQADPSDGRRQLLSLTERGRSHAEGARTRRSEWLARALQEGLSDDERAAVGIAIRLLERVIEP